MSRSGRPALIASLAAAVILAGGAIAQDQKSARPAKVDAPKKLGIGRAALPEEIKAWDISVLPDGRGLPVGRGTAKQGEQIFIEKCAACHGEFAEGVGRWPVLAGGTGTLKNDRPEKTVGSFWPAPTTLFDYVRRAMPYGNAQSLEADEIYALSAYILHMSDVIKDTDFELNEKNFAGIKLPNSGNFYDDDRETSERHFWNRQVCMTNCRKDAPGVTGRAMVLDVTPDSKTAPRVE
jgi:S-disulfanyl-L-cysteine oxidoreductase SoxD